MYDELRQLGAAVLANLCLHQNMHSIISEAGGIVALVRCAERGGMVATNAAIALTRYACSRMICL